MSRYYSNNQLLTMKDADGKTPDIYICDGNRTAGKTYSFKLTLLRAWFRKGHQFGLIVRNQVDAKGYAEAFWQDVGNDRYKEHSLKEEPVSKGTFYKIYIDDILAGFVLPLSMSRKLKRYSGMFVNIKALFFDEYQDESNVYLKDELQLLMSLHTTIARGHGEQSRRVPLYLVSNTVSILNPYYTTFGIHKMLRDNTKFLRGHGWVFQKTMNESAKKAFQESRFNQAFSNTKYYNYASENLYLNDNKALVEKPDGVGHYNMSFRFEDNYYNVKIYPSCVYVSKGYDMTYPVQVCFRPQDMTGDCFILVTRNSLQVQNLRQWFSSGLLRFDSLESKNAIFDILAYN